MLVLRVVALYMTTHPTKEQNMDIIAKAEAQREALKQEIDKLDNFLSIARELMGTSAQQTQTQTDVEPLRADVSHQIRKRAVRKPPKSGVIYERKSVV